METVMNKIDQDHAIVMIHVIDIDDKNHHLIVKDQQGNFIIKIKYSILIFF
jgi:DNA-directed RNA polymerase subunit E'/Rpb7